MAEVRFRAMTPDEYDGYLAWVIDDYAAELVRNDRVAAADARAHAEEAFASLLPRGLETPEQTLLIGVDATTGERAGLLWFGPSSNDPGRAWVNDITVDEGKRNAGWGRAMLRTFEDEARARGFTSVGLNVFGDNEIARHLYESLGYTEIARQMAKSL